MKVQALFHIQQRVGSLIVERVKDTIFDLPTKDANAGAEAGIVKILEDLSNKPERAEDRLTMVKNEKVIR